MRRVWMWMLAAQVALLPAHSPASPPRVVRATVERVTDGDTLRVISENATTLRIRLLGIDAPEIPQANKPGQPYALEARHLLTTLVMSRPVRVEMFGPDAYRRVLAIVWVGGANVNVEMVRAGLVEAYRRARCQAYCRGPTEAEIGAQQERAGIWVLERYESPAAYRKRVRASPPE